MSGAQITCGFDGAEALAALHRMGQVKTPLLRAIGVGLASNTRARFNSGTGPDGQRWRPLLPAYAAMKRGPGILVESGMLRNSISFGTGPSSVTVGSNRIYAAVHQFGATIRAKNGRGLAFHLANGQSPAEKRSGRVSVRANMPGGIMQASRLVLAQSVTVPARPYLGFGAADHDTVLDVTSAFLHAALQGRPLA